MPTNSVFFQIRAVPPLEQVGWSVRVLDYSDFTTPVAIVNEFVDLTIGPELNAPGAGSITLDADSPFWTGVLLDGSPATALLDFEYLWECYEDGILRFQFLGTNVEQRLLNQEEIRSITVSGPGIAQTLTWACVLPAYFPPAKEIVAGSTEDIWKRYPLNWSAMRIWLDQLHLAQARGTIGFVDPLFNATTDSGGQAWEVVQSLEATANGNITLDPGTNLLDLLNVHTGQDLTKQFAMRAEWVMWPGFQLDVRKTIGSHREDQVIFFEGGLDEKDRTRVRDEIANYVVTVDTYGSTSFATNPSSIAKWQQREQLQNHNQNVTDQARRTAIGQIFLAQREDEKSQWVIKVPYDQAGRRVFVDYDIGDWIGISSFRGDGTSIVDAYRVLAIVVNVTEGAPPTLELTLQSKLDARQRELQSQLTTILNRIGQGGEVTLPTPGLYPTNPPGDGWDLGWSPTAGWYGKPWDIDDIGGGGGGGGGDTIIGARVFVQPNDPGSAAQIGDLWLQTSYTI